MQNSASQKHAAHKHPSKEDRPPLHLRASHRESAVAEPQKSAAAQPHAAVQQQQQQHRHKQPDINKISNVAKQQHKREQPVVQQQQIANADNSVVQPHAAPKLPKHVDAHNNAALKQ